jgi:hypothetical protein
MKTTPLLPIQTSPKILRCLVYSIPLLLSLSLLTCQKSTTLVPTQIWGGFLKNVTLKKAGAEAVAFPFSPAYAHMKSGFVGEPPDRGWKKSWSLGPWDSVGFQYAYNDSLPAQGQTQVCTLQTVASVKNAAFLYKNIAIYKWNSAGLTDYFDAQDSRIVLTGIAFDDAEPLTASDNQEPIARSAITGKHAIKFVLSWSGDTLSGEFHWAEATGMRPPPGLQF